MPLPYPSTDERGHCVFCGIAEGSIHTPGIFWEDEEFMAFLSLWPNTEGFSVLIPRAHYPSDVLALPDDLLGRFVLAAKKASQILIDHFEDVGRVGLITEGTGVDHAHIKLFPMHGTGYMKSGQWQQHASTIKTYYETYPGYIASNEGERVEDKLIAQLAEKLRRV